MIGELGFPKGLISVEKKLTTSRRYDLLCHANMGGDIRPLLLVECKAVPLTKETEEQALGYNDLVKAPFICLVNETEIRTFWRENGKLVSIPFLPSYEELKRCIC